MAIKYRIVHTLENNLLVDTKSQFEKNKERFTAAKANFEENRSNYLKSRFKFNNIIPVIKGQCKREGWDDEINQYERCGANFKAPSCQCHPEFCAYCVAEVHGVSLSLPGVIESSAIEHHCSLKGNH